MFFSQNVFIQAVPMFVPHWASKRGGKDGRQYKGQWVDNRVLAEKASDPKASPTWIWL